MVDICLLLLLLSRLYPLSPRPLISFLSLSLLSFPFLSSPYFISSLFLSPSSPPPLFAVPTSPFSSLFLFLFSSCRALPSLSSPLVPLLPSHFFPLFPSPLLTVPIFHSSPRPLLALPSLPLFSFLLSPSLPLLPAPSPDPPLMLPSGHLRVTWL